MSAVFTSPMRAPSDPKRRFTAGDLLDERYVIQEFLAQGGMAEVYAASDRTTHDAVVIKIVGRERAGDPIALGQIRRETAALARLRHASIVRALGSGSHEGVPYLVLERLHGRALRGLLAARGRFPIQEVTTIARRLAEVLGHCHVAGVIHGDVKPDNVFVSPGQGIKLHDFGSARVAGLESQETPNAGAGLRWVGTPEYMAPEALRGMAESDERGDMYALGVLLYELLTGSVPFEGKIPDLLLAHHKGPAKSAASRRADLSPALAALVDRALAIDAAERFESMAELTVALDLALEFPSAPDSLRRSTSGARPLVAANGLPKASGIEARRSPRAPYTTPVLFASAAGTAATGRIEEISEGGTQIVSSDSLSQGAAGTLRFSLPISGRVCQVKAVVRWVKTTKSGLSAAGLEFSEIEPGSRENIATYVSLMGGS